MYYCLDNRTTKAKLEPSLLIMRIIAQNLKLEWVVMGGYLSILYTEKLLTEKLQLKKKKDQLVNAICIFTVQLYD